MRTLFLQSPTLEGLDGGGSRYQAGRELRSFLYPIWLAQVAALVPDSKLIDGPPHGIRLDETEAQARGYDLVVMHSSSPSFTWEVRAAKALKGTARALEIGLVGSVVEVDPQASLAQAAAINFVAGKEFDFTIKQVVEDRDWRNVARLSWGDATGEIHHNGRPVLARMDDLPFVTPVYKRDPNRGILRRLPETSVYLVLHRPWLQIAQRLLPLAADGWRTPLSHPRRRECRG